MTTRDPPGTRRGTAYCSATDRTIPVLIREPEGRRTVPNPRDAAEAVICLDYGVRCTGYLCPLFSLPVLQEEELPESPHARRASADA